MVHSTFTLVDRFFRISKEAWKPFAIYGISYSLLGLLVPLIVQLLVNHLAMVGLNLSLLTLAIVMTVGLALLQLSRLAQIVLLEYLERRIMGHYAPLFAKATEEKRPYYFELTSVPKALSKWALEGFEIILALIVGSIILMVYHPFFIVLMLMIWGTLIGVYWLGKKGLASGLEESNQKYKIWHSLQKSLPIDIQRWLEARHGHFQILRRQIVLIMIAQIVGTVALMLVGAYLFHAGELSLGQFVAAELIGGGIFVAMNKLCKFMETHYALLTSFIKIDHALEGKHE